jgi:hypothetical protein
MVVDSNGRAYAGNFGFDLMTLGDPAPANLIHVDPDGTASVAADEMLFPNGSVITPGGRTLIVGELHGNLLPDGEPPATLGRRHIRELYGAVERQARGQAGTAASCSRMSSRTVFGARPVSSRSVGLTIAR